MNKNVTRLLTLGGALGVVATAWAAIRGYEKTKDILIEHDFSLKEAFEDAEVRWEVVKAVAPAAVAAIATEGCILGCQAVNAKNIAILGGAAGAIGSQLKNIDRAMTNVMGREAWLELKSKMNLDEARKQFDKKTKKKFEKIEHKMKDDEEVYYDSITKQYVALTEMDVIRVENMINKTFQADLECSVSSYVSFFNKPTLVSQPKDDDWGWYMDAEFDDAAAKAGTGYYISLHCERGFVDGDHEAIIITPSVFPSDPTTEWYSYHLWRQSRESNYRLEPGDQLDLPF